MTRPLVFYPDPVLARRAEEIAEVTPELRALADDMALTMYANEGIGLAAPQVGQSVRLVVVDISGPKVRDDLRVLVNPVITARSEETVESEEGCLSVRNYRANVERAAQVTVQARTLDGQELTIEADDLLAICLQHEIDHLDGTLFIDHISRLKRSLYDKKVRKWVKQDKAQSE
ncbi:peptide deformylase [Desulfocurvus vexinensis]|uniref:peptide deformylase n=1 Tax=Desulfocurvus vexinensis TaxID=399548 RepID=UPI000491909B|nr:peptide deformylase [Desulfocurvus vexinensis]